LSEAGQPPLIITDKFNDAGYRVFCTELDEFISTGGSAKKLALRLDDGPADLPFGLPAQANARKAIQVAAAFR
jgi:hypothetical protein